MTRETINPVIAQVFRGLTIKAFKRRQACGRDARVYELWGKAAYTDGKAKN